MIGIYKITNTANDKYYIGLSINIERRWNDHKSLLRINKHPNKHLQRAYIKYTADSFEFSIIEECDKDILNIREIYWVDYYKNILKKDLYNIANAGGKGNGLEGTNHPMFDNSTNTYYHIDGRIEKDVTGFFMKNKYKIDSGNMAELLQGKRFSAKGWRITEEINKKHRNKLYTFYHITGIIETNITIMDMCRKYNLSKTNLHHLVKNRAKQASGWYINKDIINNSKRDIINSNGNIKYSITQTEFRELSGCDSCGSSLLFNNKISTVRGWKLYKPQDNPL